jgi:hypothetical protein
MLCVSQERESPDSTRVQLDRAASPAPRRRFPKSLRGRTRQEYYIILRIRSPCFFMLQRFANVFNFFQFFRVLRDRRVWEDDLELLLPQVGSLCQQSEFQRIGRKSWLWCPRHRHLQSQVLQCSCLECLLDLEQVFSGCDSMIFEIS